MKEEKMKIPKKLSLKYSKLINSILKMDEPADNK